MSRTVEINNKDNKKKGKEQKQQKSQWRPVENPKKLPEATTPLKMVRSPKIKKKTSQDQVSSEQVSETMEVTGYDDEKSETMTVPLTISPSKPALPAPITILEAAPPTHYISISVALGPSELSDFMANVKHNKNMVITRVPISLMADLMPGDQISGVNGSSVWNIADLEREIQECLKIGVEMSLVRVWNIKCLSKSQVDQIATQIEVGRQYFAVKIYCENGATGGLKLGGTWKSVTVQNVRADTPVSKVLLAGDEVLCVDSQLLAGKNKRAVVKQAYRLVTSGVQQKGYAELIASRRIGARSSPAPSLEAELGNEFADYAAGVPKGVKMLQKTPSQLMSLPFAADSLEIALRELTFLRQWVQPEQLEHTPCDKGESLMTGEQCARTPVKSRMMPVMSCSPSNTSPCNSSTPHDSQALPPTSMAMPIGDKSIGIQPNTISLNPGQRGFGEMTMAPSSSQKSTKNSTVKFAAKHERSNITSDIPEEDELKKCHEGAGIISYIKNKYGK